VWLHAQYGDVADEDRLAFALAAYNIGLGHVEDARRLARARGLDPNRWAGHVSEVLPLLADERIAAEMPHGIARGGVTVNFVTRVLGLYGSFKRIAPGDSPLPAGSP
jgi:membrane-bound lytic murein transglycosylase F